MSRIEVRAAPGVPQAELAQRVRSVLPTGTQAVTGTTFTREAREDINSDFLTGFRTLLVVFAGIALLVASFSIYNTFAIVVAQRTRESALMRAIGASRRQVLGTVLVEVIGVAVLSSVAGLFAGLGVAGLLKGMFDSFGFALPAGGLVVNASAIIASLTVGVVLTVVAGVVPAVRASRVAPVEALRESEATLPTVSVARVVTAIALLGAGAFSVVVGLMRDGTSALAPTGLGGLGVLAGVVVAGPLIARPIARLIGAPIARTRRVTGGLARQNAVRNPRRTASTASALLVGVTVVTLFTVFAASLKAGIDDVVNQSFGGDLVVNTPSFGGGALSPKVADAVAEVPDVQRAVGIGNGNAKVAGEDLSVTVAEPSGLGSMLDLGVVKGSLTTMHDDEIAVSDVRAKDHGWTIGSPVRVGFTDRSTVTAHVGAVYHDRQLVGGVVMPKAMYAPHAVQPTDVVVLVDVRNGVTLDAAKAQIEKAVAPFGAPSVQDRQEYIASVSSGADLMLGIVYVMLALAIVIALMGIANTLSLAVHERTREVGLLRAVGETRRQVRSMIRWESVIIATFGTVLGLAVGVFLAWSLVQAAGSGGLVSFAVPAGRMAIVLFVGAVVGVLAAVRPARRAAKANVMDAIATA